jgi:hypothetical protein
MKRYACDMLFKHNENNSITLLIQALDVLGFTPNYMSIFFNEFEKSLDDITYDKDYLLKCIKNKPHFHVTLNQQLYSVDNREINNWFKFIVNADSPFGLNTCSLEWSNTQLDFLLNEKIIKSFLENPNFIYCYCYNQYDVSNQSNEQVDSFIENYPNQPYKIVKNFMGDIVIDISQHWGRFIATRGITFMAAPLMWFGGEYFKIIPKESLLKFPGASLVNYPSLDLVHIKLFDLYDDPSKKENREKQKLFWKTFDLQKRIEQYEKDRPIDFIAWYKEKAAKKKKKK